MASNLTKYLCITLLADSSRPCGPTAPGWRNGIYTPPIVIESAMK